MKSLTEPPGKIWREKCLNLFFVIYKILSQL